MPKSKGFRRKSRSILTRPRGARSGAKPEIYLREFKPGDKVVIRIDPSVQRGAPHRRYHGRVGEVIGRRGKAYIISIALGDKLKKLIILPDHLTEWGG
ncbi:MAG: 50S ribosomal protein L21e [Candidatus Caldarchaeales archaeon]